MLLGWTTENAVLVKKIFSHPRGNQGDTGIEKFFWL